jgi:transcriptional regulator with XRE-family HTH domain
MEEENTSSSGERVVRGVALIQAIQEEAQAQGLTVKQVAERFELAPSYWFSMCNGNRSIQALHRHRLKLIAKFLARPYIEVLSLAELVEPEDFIIPQTIDDQLNLVYLKLKADSMWNPLVPKEEVWDAADRGLKILLVSFYERLFSISILDKAKITQYVHAGDPALPPATPAVASEQVVVAPKGTPKTAGKGASKPSAKSGRKGKSLATA